MADLDRFRGCLLGLAIGDALGTTVEFRARGTFAPVTEIVGGGPFGLEPGEWTDDTPMALCLATSLVELNRFDPQDQMEQYCRWPDHGYRSSNGRCFDIGGTVASALQRYRRSGNAFAGSTDTQSAGNGCFMRLAAVPIFSFPDRTAAIRYSGESSRTTHGANECLDACRLLGSMIYRALGGGSKEAVLLGDAETFQGSPQISAIARGEDHRLLESDIRGSGSVDGVVQREWGGAFAFGDAAVCAKVAQQRAALYRTVAVSRSASGGTPAGEGPRGQRGRCRRRAAGRKSRTSTTACAARG